MSRWLRGAVIAVAGVLLVAPPSAAQSATHPRLTPGAGEIALAPGMIEGAFLISASVRKALSPCLDLGGTLAAVPSRGRQSDLLFTAEVRYGLWYCCIPERYIDYLYFSAGAGSFSRMGLAERENGFALTGGPGLRIDLFGRFIVGVELKGYAVFRDGGRDGRLAVLFTGGLPL
jgi:hypothetical protein